MDSLHLHKNVHHAQYHHLFLLMLPTIVFVLTIAFFMQINRVQIAKNTEEISVLGESDQLDRGTK